MRSIARLLPILAILTLVAAPVTLYAAGKKAKNEVVMKMGSKVHLFHSSKGEAQKDIAVGEVLPVYRATGKYGQEKREVGQVKVLSFLGEHYFEAEIVKGDVKVGDIATKDESGFLVQPAK